MATVFYLTHPEVLINPSVPVTDWGLSDTGRARALEASGAGWTSGIRRIVTSREVKALQTAEIFAKRKSLIAETRAAMHENDRSATGYLPPAEFESVADLFFASPFRSIRGWERAIDAQSRIVGEVETVLATPPKGDLLIVGHGAVGTLLMAFLLRLSITRTLDQPPGGGNVFAFDADTRQILHRWRRLEELSVD